MTIIWGAPLQFQDGTEALLHATVWASGKLKYWATGESIYAETWAEFYEAGVRRIVREANSGGLLFYNEEGYPLRISMDGVNLAMGLPPGIPHPKPAYRGDRVMNADVVAKHRELLEEIPGWGSW